MAEPYTHGKPAVNLRDRPAYAIMLPIQYAVPNTHQPMIQIAISRYRLDNLAPILATNGCHPEIVWAATESAARAPLNI